MGQAGRPRAFLARLGFIFDAHVLLFIPSLGPVFSLCQFFSEIARFPAKAQNTSKYKTRSNMVRIRVPSGKLVHE
jgi:hypothetical protein